MQAYKNFIAIILFFSLPTLALAGCPDGYARDSLGLCEPTFTTDSHAVAQAAQQAADAAKNAAIQGVIGPIQVVKNLSQGDLQSAYQNIGRTIMEGPTCMFCSQVVKAILGDKGNDDLEQIVGNGFVIFLDTSTTPIVVLYNPTTKTAGTQELEGPQTPPATVNDDSLVKRGTKNFVAVPSAVCITQSTGGKVFAGFSAPPNLIDVSTNTTKGDWEADLRVGDILTFKAPLCPALNKPGETSVSEASVVYGTESPMRYDIAMKYAFWGQATPH